MLVIVEMMMMLLLIKSRLARLLFVSVALAGIGCARPNSPSASTGATAPPLSPDGGLPDPKSSRQGVIVPSDTGMNAAPSGSASSTGTSGGSMGKSLGNPGGGGGN